MEAQWIYGIMGMADKVNSKYSGPRAWWQRCGTIWIDTVEEEIQDGNRRDEGLRRWRNGLEERRQTGQISTGNNY